MKYLILVILSSYIYGHISQNNNFIFSRNAQNRLSFKLNSRVISQINQSLIVSSLSGDKRSVPKEVKRLFKDFGLMHLLTPSGLHLSSFLVLSFGNSFFIFIILILLLLFIFQFGSYYSLERVIYFKLIYVLSKFSRIKINLYTIFILTMVFSVLLGNYTNSPLSFLYSILFWGTILIHSKNKLLLLLALNITLHIVGIMTTQQVNISSVFINPFLTSTFILIFPLFILRLVVGELYLLDLFIEHFLRVWMFPLQYFGQFKELNTIHFSFWTLIACYLFLYLKRYKVALLVLLMSIQPLTPYTKSKSSKKKIIVNLPDYEYLRFKKGKLYYEDRYCKNYGSRISCRKRPSRYGGPRI